MKVVNRLIFFVLLASCSLVNAAAFTPLNSDLQVQIEKGLLYSVNNEFEQAEQLFKQMITEYPQLPVGYFYLGATLQAKMLDAEDFSQTEEFYGYMEKTIKYARNLKSNEPDNVWGYFYEGSAALYKSYQKSKLNKWFSAYRDARHAVKELEKSIKLDSTFYDAYLGVGSYKYWKTVRAGYLVWLPIISNETDLGLEMVRLAMDKGALVKLVARDQFCWILLYQKKYDKALEVARENCANFPQSRFFKWTLVELAYEAGRWDEAEATYLWLLNEIKKMENNNHYNEIECLLKLAEISLIEERLADAEHYVAQIFEIKCADDIRKKAKKKLKRALEIQNECRRAAEING